MSLGTLPVTFNDKNKMQFFLLTPGSVASGLKAEFFSLPASTILHVTRLEYNRETVICLPLYCLCIDKKFNLREQPAAELVSSGATLNIPPWGCVLGCIANDFWAGYNLDSIEISS